MSETGSSQTPKEVKTPKKELGDRVAEFFEELEKIVSGMSRDQVRARSNAAQQRLREAAEEEDTPTTG